MQLPETDIYLLVKSTTASGSWIAETDIDDKALINVEQVFKHLDDETVRVMKANLFEGWVVDASEDVALAWIAHHEVNGLPEEAPALVDLHAEEQLEEARLAAERERQAHVTEQRWDVAEYRASVL